MLRYWTDALSEAQAKGLADAIAQVFTSFIEKPSESISELEVHGKTLKVDALRPRKLSQSINGTPLEGLDNHSLTRLIDDRVNEVIRQMLREGQLRLPSQSDKSTAVKEPSCENKYSPVPAERRTDETEKANTPPAPQGREKPDEVESKLWNVWSSSLGLPSSVVKARDSFFKLGGDSITAMKMVSAAREQGLALSVADVFNKPTFKDMLATVRAATVPLPTIPVAQDQKESEKPRENKTILTKSIPLQADSALRFANVDTSSLRNGICPRVGVFKGGIADVLPVTDFQSLSITATLFKSRWMLNYFYLDGKGPLDLRRLRESCMRVVDSFDILRAVFVCLRGQFFQVVLRKVRPSIFVYETEESMDEFTESLRQKDREQEPRQGEQYVKFFIVKKKGSDQHRILIRLSHTQFDGVCVSKIMSALKMAYEGSPLPPVSSFANYMRLLPSTITPENYQHWATLLKGSKMPAIIRREGPNTFQHIGSFTELKKTIQLPSSGLGNITMATVIQAAWSMTLAKLCAQSDVVFGMTINGRNTTIPGVENTVGPCVNTVPVRVKFEEQWTGLDLFRYLQDQQISNMPYESLGFREIIRHCTDWPDSTYFTTSVFHQNVDYEGHLQLDNTWYRIGGAGAIDSLSDLTVVSKQTSTTTLDISLGYSLKSAIHPAFAAKALNMLSETLDCLITNPNTILPSASTLRSLPSQSIPDHPRSSDAHFLSSHLKSRSIAELLVHSDILSKTWLQVLPARDGDKITPSSTSSPITNHSPFQLDSSFFDLGGDIFSMAQLVWLLDQEGLHVRLEDLLDHPTFLGQMAVLALHNQTSGEVDVDDIDAGSAEKHVDNRSQQSMEKSESRTPWGKAVTLARRFTKKSFVLSWA